MNEHCINEEAALLDEFSVVTPQKGKLFDALLIASIFYIGFIIIDFSIDLQTLSLKSFDWEAVSIILILPILGVVLHLNGKKAGWIINCFYYLLIASISFYTFLQILFEEENISLEMSWRGLLLLMLALASTALLFSNPIRKYFRVSTRLFIMIPVISIGLAIVMAFTVLQE